MNRIGIRHFSFFLPVTFAEGSDPYRESRVAPASHSTPAVSFFSKTNRGKKLGAGDTRPDPEPFTSPYPSQLLSAPPSVRRVVHAAKHRGGTVVNARQIVGRTGSGQ